jgi:hypothetical protein
MMQALRMPRAARGESFVGRARARKRGTPHATESSKGDCVVRFF